MTTITKVFMFLLGLCVLGLLFFYGSMRTKKYLKYIPIFPSKNNIKNITPWQKEESSPFQMLLNLHNHSCCFSFSLKEKEDIKKCNICSVVTSSGHLLGSGAGEEIDKADCVMRLNVSPTNGYEIDVGNKTTLRYMAQRAAKTLIKNPKVLTSDSMGTQTVFYGVDSHLLKKIYELYPKSKIYCIQGIWMNQAVNIFHAFGDKILGNSSLGTISSTGFKAITLALQFCQKIIVYGISSPLHCIDVREKKTVDVPYHYYDPPAKNNKSAFGQKECFNFRKWKNNYNSSSHIMITEKYIYSLWAKMGINITFRFPQWTYKEIMDLNIKSTIN